MCFDENCVVMKFFVTLLISFFFTSSLFSQDSARTKASVIIFNENNVPLENATVELRHSKDSSLIKTALTDKSGLAEFEKVAPGSYIFKVTSVNFAPHFSTAFHLTGQQQEQNVPAITMVRASAELQGVTVTGKKPFIQKLTDRIVVNVESSIASAGSSALDVLETSPGITLDQNDAISLRGKAGVTIMIDGKPTAMAGADLANYLRGLPANAIETIHIITNPSAKYDAAGNSGIIDIRMKKDQRFGTNGTFTAGYGQGIYPKANAGTTLNYRDKKVNIFGNYNFAYRKHLNHLILNRNFFNNGVFIGSDDKDNYAKMPVNSNTVRVGADYFANKKTIIGFVVNSNFNHFRRRSDNNTIGSNALHQPYYTFHTLATNNDHNNNTVANINYKHSFNTTGKEITADVDYGVFNSNSITRTASKFFDMGGNSKQDDEILDGDQDGKLTLRTAKVDYTNPLKKKAKLELGLKTSHVSADNDAKFFNVFTNRRVVDEYKTNRFFYDEYNNAVYVNLSKEYEKFNLQFGLRGEQTNLKTLQENGGAEFKKSYFELFPSAFFNYKLKENKTVGLSVSRRIDRPSYSSLNPFLFMIDATVYATGEPHLKPQMTWSYETNYTVKNMNFTLGYSHTKNPQNMVISRILDVIPNFEIKPEQDSNITVQIPVNLQSSDYVGLTATTPIKINKWWNMVNNLNVYYNHFNGNLGGTQLSNGAPAANVRTNNTFTFKKGWSAELNANLNTGGRYGYSVSEPQWGVAVGAQKTVLKGKGTVRLNMSDIFWTNLPKATITYEGRYIENWHAYRETRVANLSFTYRFGSNKVQQARRRTTASEEEIRRAGGN